MEKRLDELDSLRGIFILSIVVYHIASIFPLMANDTSALGFTWFNILKYTPLHIFWAGNEAVIFFYILSGFVLYLPFRDRSHATAGVVPQRNDGTDKKVFEPFYNYMAFLLKKFCRIYIPYFASIVVAITIKQLCPHNILHGLSRMIQTKWSQPIPFHEIINHLLLVTYFDPLTLNPAIWFLIHEIRIIIVFPLIAFCVKKHHFCINLIIMIALYGAWHVLVDITHSYSRASFNNSIHYMTYFFLGALLAKNYPFLVECISKFSRTMKYILLITGIALYVNPYFTVIQSMRLDFPTKNHITALGIVIFIVLSLSSRKVSRILHNPILLFSGKISYSLFLYHGIILIFFLQFFYLHVSIWIIISAVFLLSVGVSSMAYLLIEKPAFRMGKYLSNKFFA